MTPPSHRYRLYDLIVESDSPLSLSRYPSEGEIQSVWSFEMGPFESVEGRCVHDVLDFDGKRRLQVWIDDRPGVVFLYGETRIEWNQKERRIRMNSGSDLRTRPAIALERMVAPIAMMLQRPRHIALHASAVGDGTGDAVIFVGDSGAGKSTTALEMMRRGMELLADDLVLIDAESGRLYAAMPSLRLFDEPGDVPEAVDRELVMPATKKYWYQLPEDGDRSLNPGVAAIYSLEPDVEAKTAEVERVRGREATVRVIAQAFDLTKADDDWRAARFRALCQLARGVAVYRVRYDQRDRRAIEQVEAIATHHLDSNGAE